MQIITTEDGSHTLFSEQFNEVYHSLHGAIQESEHVFIKQGLDYVLASALQEELRIFELGFGTGLNALLTMLEAEKRNIKITYTTMEAHPLPIETIKALNYTDQLGFEYCYGPYHTLHLCRWNERHQITRHFSFKKIHDSVFNWQPATGNYQLVFFDAFAPAIQPEIWSVEVFRKMYDALVPKGILVTYCSKVSVQKAMKDAGFVIEKVKGPIGKREMLRAHKQ
jgi:tRNA U34 5-methylaminomethyl-2-thiouridine-forming methyltransferase MnmC